MTVAEQIAEWLDEKCIRHAFGIIGAGNLSLWEAIEKKGATQIVCCHHEAAAATAASFFARTNGLVGVAVVTTGAGSTNAITGVMAAYMDSTPLLVLSGNETMRSLEDKTRVKGVQGYRSERLAHGFTKSAVRLDDWEGGYAFAHDCLDTMLYEATVGRPGPVWIDIPRDVQNATI